MIFDIDKMKAILQVNTPIDESKVEFFFLINHNQPKYFLRM